MATAASTLVIKTEGVTESYSDIGKLLGPLQGINTMLYQLNKALGIQNKQSIASGKSLEKLGKEGNKTAQSQLALQKQLRATAKEAAQAAKEQVTHAKSTSESLEKLNSKLNFHMAVEGAKKFAKATQEVVKFASSAFRQYEAMGGQLNNMTGQVAYIEQDWEQCKGIIAEIVTNDLPQYFGDCATNVDVLGGMLSSAYSTSADIGGIFKKISIIIGGVINAYVKQFQETIALFKSGKIWKALNHKADVQGMVDQLKAEMGEFDKKTQESKRRVDELLLNRKGWQELRAEVKNTATHIKQSFKQAVEETTPTLEEQHQLNLKHIADELAAKLAALDEIEGNEQVKAGLRSQLLTQSLEAEKAEKLRYAQETNDQLYIMNAQLRAAEDAANKAAAEARRIEAQKQLAEVQAIQQKWIDIADGIKNNLAKGAFGELTGAAESLFDQMISGEEMTREGAYEMMSSMAKNIAKVGFQNLLSLAGELIMSSATSASKVPVIGPALAAAAMATFGGLTAALMAKYKPKQAQVQYENGGYISAGLVKGGVANKDSVMAALMPGERVLSKKEAEEYDEGNTGSTIQNITINVSGQFNTPQQITQMVRQTIIPELRKATRAGLSIGA